MINSHHYFIDCYFGARLSGVCCPCRSLAGMGIGVYDTWMQSCQGDLDLLMFPDQKGLALWLLLISMDVRFNLVPVTCDWTPPGSPRYLKLSSSHGQLERASMVSCEQNIRTFVADENVHRDIYFCEKSATADSEWAQIMLVLVPCCRISRL